jgi:hypothetical protein
MSDNYGDDEQAFSSGDEADDTWSSSGQAGGLEAEVEPADTEEQGAEYTLAPTEIEEFAAGGEETAAHPSIQGNVGVSH